MEKEVDRLEREVKRAEEEVEYQLMNALLIVHELSVRLESLKRIGLRSEIVREDISPLAYKLGRIIGTERRSGTLIDALVRLESAREALVRAKEK